jgi:hypothetical protein
MQQAATPQPNTQEQNPMTYAHIFKANHHTGKKFVLILSEGFQPIGRESFHDTKAEAKAAAKAAGAKAWNY